MRAKYEECGRYSGLRFYTNHKEIRKKIKNLGSVCAFDSSYIQIICSKTKSRNLIDKLNQYSKIELEI